MPFEGEERVLVPSPKVATYDLQPSMSAVELTDRLLAEIARQTLVELVLVQVGPQAGRIVLRRLAGVLVGELRERALDALTFTVEQLLRAVGIHPVTLQQLAEGRRLRVPTAAQAMNGMSSVGIVTKGRIMSRSSCSRMWQWYMYRPL